ncbi:DNA-3-methyladenine glycosidase [Roseibium aquae]|uniref:DNA-3-methyladenine glycosylase II n=1 Tax=Roseibium aquae TaxID=1323746 RepID=A0A916TBS3_9HYPH|nr:DNA-3-methyladenine glycosidase [Roseibium aquae]
MLQAGLTDLCRIDPRLCSIGEVAGDIPLRRREADFAGLAQIITGQQVSTASAAAIFARLSGMVVPLDPSTLWATPDETLKSAGLSRPKIRALRAASRACLDGLDLAHLATRSPGEAHATLCAIKGIGPWTADIFLLFCAGHPDVFPSGDLALQIAVEKALELEARPTARQLDQIALDWSPWRSVAARLFWAWYRAYRNGQESLPL